MAARSVARILVVATAAGLALTGCTSAERPAATIEPNGYAGPPIGSVAPSPSPAAAAAPAAATGAPSAGVPAAGVPAAGPPAAGPGPAAPAGKVSATTASEQDIVRALTAAGVPTPGRWADEIIEYRPYPAGDPTLAKLRQNLAKENPPPGVVDKIVSALTP